MQTIKNHQHDLTLFLLLMQILFLQQDNGIRLCSELLKEWSDIHDLSCVLKFRMDFYSFS